jgi:hypothetical protein
LKAKAVQITHFQSNRNHELVGLKKEKSILEIICLLKTSKDVQMLFSAVVHFDEGLSLLMQVSETNVGNTWHAEG